MQGSELDEILGVIFTNHEGETIAELWAGLWADLEPGPGEPGVTVAWHASGLVTVEFHD